MSKSKPSRILQFPGSVMVRQADLAEEVSLRTGLMHKRNYIREILEKDGKVEPGPHSAKLVNASWAVGGKTLEIR